MKVCFTCCFTRFWWINLPLWCISDLPSSSLWHQAPWVYPDLCQSPWMWPSRWVPSACLHTSQPAHTVSFRMLHDGLQGFPGGSAVKNLSAVQEPRVRSMGGEDSLEGSMATHSSILVWRIPQTEEPGRIRSLGSQSETRLRDSAQHMIAFTAFRSHRRGCCLFPGLRLLLWRGVCDLGHSWEWQCFSLLYHVGVKHTQSVGRSPSWSCLPFCGLHFWCIFQSEASFYKIKSNFSFVVDATYIERKKSKIKRLKLNLM